MDPPFFYDVFNCIRKVLSEKSAQIRMLCPMFGKQMFVVLDVQKWEKLLKVRNKEDRNEKLNQS